MKESNVKMSSKDLTTLALRSSFLQASFNFERMQAGGWLFAMLPFLKRIYKDDKKGLQDAMVDNLEFLNTTPVTSGFLMGLVLSLEENKESRTTINGLKTALFGPLAGIGDAIFWFTLLPIVAGVCASFASEGQIMGPILFFLTYVGVFCTRIIWTRLGYTLGVSAVEKIKKSSQTIAKAASILGVTVIGGLMSAYLNITVLTEIPVSDTVTISLQTGFFDKIMPKLLPVAFTFLMYYLLKKKNVNPTVLIFGTFIGAILLAMVGVL